MNLAQLYDILKSIPTDYEVETSRINETAYTHAGGKPYPTLEGVKGIHVDHEKQRVILRSWEHLGNIPKES